MAFSKKFIFCYLFIWWTFCLQAADNCLIVHNLTEKPMFLGMYYVYTTLFNKSVGPALRYHDAVCAMPHTHVHLQRPCLKFKNSREIIYSPIIDDLKPKLEKKEYRLSSTKRAGITHGSSYYIVDIDGVTKILTQREWQNYQKFCKNDDQNVAHDIHGQQAYVRASTKLNDEEQIALSRRLIHVKDCLESIFKRQIPERYVPRIALCLSGGGMRAATCSVGLFEGLNQLGLLDAITWVSGLSGSSWFMSHYGNVHTSINDYHNLFLTVACSSENFVPGSIKELSNIQWRNESGNTLIDYYGWYIAHKFFRNIQPASELQRVVFSSLRTCIDQGTMFIPLCTAVEMTYSRHNPVWYTFTPYEVGSDELGLYVPTWAFGRKFCNGLSTDDKPEMPLSFFMGLWGSALSGTFKQLFDHACEKTDIHSRWYIMCKKIIQETIGAVRMLPIKVDNPFYGLSTSLYKNMSHLNFVDAGYHFNLPLPPLLHPDRAVDVIIMLDASRKVQYKEGAHALRKAYEYVIKKGFPFPKIDENKIVKNSINVFFDRNNPKAPLVIYIPVYANEAHPELPNPEVAFFNMYNTSHFSYSKSSCENLINLVCYNIVENKDVIFNALNLKIEQKHENDIKAA